jgi:hypothetical protein
LAQLLPNEDLFTVANHYRRIRLFKLFLLPPAEGRTLSEATKQDVERLMATTDDAINAVKKYLLLV